ncbi:kelch-like protein 33 isoform X2 [Ctenopharyngodon idella]|uniref:kelch-like protein 33 isoform X2 n=1 Tax=Ctenopharyngodon idella TaxID=7959 RepID=UPI002232ADF6|nr:kelch-like protein 33 isoform X2 [Ctenopharyngodon idella]
MSQHKTRGNLEKKEANMSIHLQSGSSVKGRRAGEERREKEAGSRIASSSLKGDVREKKSIILSPPTSTFSPPTFRKHPPIEPFVDPELRPFVFSTHCDTLFASLQGLKEEGLLLDCSLKLQGKSYKAHRLMLAAVSQKAEAWLLSGEAGLKEVELDGGRMTPTGLKAVLDFSYSGEVDRGETDEVLEACRGLGAERLEQLCGGDVLVIGSRERERSLQIIQTLWEGNIGCDIIIQADSGDRFPAHRVILAAGADYFRALFCGGLRESGEDVVLLRGVASWVLRNLLDFIYSGRLKLSCRTVWDLTEAASQFQLQGALSLCLNFLQDNMDETSCLDVLALAEAHSLEDLRRRAEDYVLAHFQRVAEGEKFRDLPCVQLQRLLERDALNADSELDVFRAVVNWVEDDKDQRLCHLSRLMQGVRFRLMRPEELLEVQDCKLLVRSSGGKTALEIVNNLLHGDKRTSDCKPRTPNQVLVLVGGDCVNENFERREPNLCLWFAHRFMRGEGLIRTIEWRPLARLPEPPRFRHCVCVLNNTLYILGGRKYYGALDILKTALRFDPAQGRWECLPDMSSPRDYFAAVCHRGKVFVLGGNSDDMNCLDSVECYTPDDNTWRLSHPLDVALCGHAAAVLNGEMFVSGGCDSRLRCYPCLWLYDPVRGCSKRAPMTVGAGRAGHVMLVAGHRLVVAGGLQPMLAGFGDQLQCESYDPVHDSWSSFPFLPRPHLSPAAVTLDGQLYVLGGSSADSARDTSWVHRYDPQAKCWDKLGAMPRPYADLAACALQLPVSLKS